MARIHYHPQHRPARLPDGSPLDYAPDNEQGVVFLFSHLAHPKYGLRVERIQAGFPDCVAYRDTERIRIEFEYRSRNFATHKHDVNGCDWLVCWIHDWVEAPKHLRIVELRKDYGLGFAVWVLPVSGEFGEALSEISSSESWSVPSQANKGDLLLFYRAAPFKFIRDIFTVTSSVEHVDADWKTGLDYMAPIRRICTLKAPIHLSELRNHRVLQNASFVRGSMRRRFRASQNWPELYQMIISRNPDAEPTLQRYGPDKVA